MEKINRVSKYFPYFFAIAATLFIELLVFSVPGFDWHLPRDYSQDGLFMATGIKSIIDTGWFITNSYLGAPGIYQLYDFPTSDSASMGIIYLLSFFSHSYGVLFNLFYFLTFPLCAIFSLYVFLKLRLKPWYAVSASLLYTFIPYHIFRSGGHLLLCTYYVVPLYLLFAIEVFRGKSFFKMSKSQIFWRGVVIAFAASSGIYYGYFGAFFILLAGIYGWSVYGRKNAFVTACAFSTLIAIVTIINVSPTIWFQARVGHNPSAGHSETLPGIEVTSLKMTQMLLPVTGHRIGVLRIYKNGYEKKAALVNENFTSTLGIVGDVGFIMLLWVFIMKKRQALDEHIELFGALNLSAILLATVGGLSIFALLILPQIRSYNRISVFIAFFSLYTVFYYLQIYHAARRAPLKHALILLLIVTLGLLDEIPSHFAPDYLTMKKNILSDQDYVHQIETILPKNASVFQLPYSEFPEGAKVVYLKDYEQFKEYLNDSRQLKWSYGAMKGRGIGSWESRLNQLPVKDQLNKIVLAGFDGVSINKEGYSDNAQSLATQLTDLLKEQPLESQDKKLLFYNLIPYKTQLQKTLGKNFAVQQTEIKNNMSLGFKWHPDFAEEEIHGDQHWRWAGKHEKLEISSDNLNPIKLTLSFGLQTGTPKPATITITGGPFHEYLKVNNQETLVRKTFLMRPGSSIKILFETDAQSSQQGPDEKSSYFRLNNFKSEVQIV